MKLLTPKNIMVMIKYVHNIKYNELVNTNTNINIWGLWWLVASLEFTTVATVVRRVRLLPLFGLARWVRL